MGDSVTVSQAQIAGRTDVTRAAVTQWRKRHSDFPAPVGDDGDLFDLDEVIDWLDGRPIPASNRKPDEAAGATYGDRLRRWKSPAESPDDEGLLLRSLRTLGPEVCGNAPRSDYLYLLACVAFLRLHDQNRWTELTRHVPPSGDPGDARRLLQLVVTAVDRSLGYPDLLSSLDAPPTRLRPRAFEPVRKILELSVGLCPSDFRQLRAAFMREAVRGDAICTPPSVTRTMVALLANHTAQGNVSVYDPFARFGELLAEFVQGAVDPAAVRVNIEHPDPAHLRLAGMSLAATGTRAELATTPSPPPSGATFLLSNPPFGQHTEPEWLQRCVESLAEDGRAAVLMPYSAGFDPSVRAREVRCELVEHGAVLAVVALPPKMFSGTSVGVCAWLLRHPTGHAAPVRLVDARHLGRPPGTQAPGVHVLGEADAATIAAMVAASESQLGFGMLAAPDEIRARRYSLYPPEYQDRTLAPMSAAAARAELDALPEELRTPSYTTGQDAGWPQHPLDDLCDIRSGMPYGSLKQAKSRALTARETVPVVHPQYLCRGHIQAGGAEHADTADQERHRLQTGDVLWVRTGAMGQTAIVGPSESGWLPHTNLLRLRVTETGKLDPAYLLAYLSQAVALARIRDRSVRSVTTSISAATLGALEIPLPPLADQRRIASALQALNEQTTAIERRLADARAAQDAFGRHLTDGTVVLTGRESQ